MILKSFLAATTLIAANAALAQTSAPSAEPSPAAVQAIQQTAMAFSQCVSGGVAALAASVTPEAGAASVLGGCATQRDQLVAAAEALIANIPADQQAGAREQLRSHLAGAEAQIAESIRQARTAAAAPAPAPAATPGR